MGERMQFVFTTAFSHAYADLQGKRPADHVQSNDEGNSGSPPITADRQARLGFTFVLFAERLTGSGFTDR
jgi:hypothetical protein